MGNRKRSYLLGITALVLAAVIVGLAVQPIPNGSSTSSTSLTGSTSRSSTPSLLVGFQLQGISGAFGAYGSTSYLVAAPGLTMNYSVLLTRFDRGISQVNLTTSAPSGVSASVVPSNLIFFGDETTITVEVSVLPSVDPGSVLVHVSAATSDGIANTTFDFHVLPGLVVLFPNPRPQTVFVKAGQTVSWLNLEPLPDEGQSLTATVAVRNDSTGSPALKSGDFWSKSFSTPGTYVYSVSAYGYSPATGEVIVR